MNRLSRQFALPLMFLGALVCSGCHGSSSPPSSASSGASNGTYMYCYTTSSAHGITVSSVFHVPPVDQVTMLEEPWAKDFRTFVGQSGDEGERNLNDLHASGSQRIRSRAQRPD